MKKYYLPALLLVCAFVSWGAAGRIEPGKHSRVTRIQTFAPPVDTAHGLIGYYYQDPSNQSQNFDTLKLVRVDSVIAFSWGNDAPTPNDFSSSDNFSVRWIGLIEAPVTGTYTFHTNTDDGSRLYINGIDVVDYWGSCCSDHSGTINLVAGKKYPVKFEMHEMGGGAGVSYFKWEAPGIDLQQVPTQYLYAITPETASKPAIKPVAGLYEGQATITLATPTAGATIHYTLDGSDPDENAPVYDNPFELTQSGTVKAVAYRDGMFTSAIASATYTIIPPLVSTPTFTPSAGTFDDTLFVRIHTQEPDTHIYYTLDGSTPDSNSLLYTGGIEVDSTTRVKAYALKDGYTPSQVGSATFTILPPGVDAPMFSLPGGDYPAAQQVAITCGTPGATIHYALNDEGLNAGSPVYTQPVTISKTATLKAYAEKEGIRDSKVMIATYTIGTDDQKADTPHFSSPAGHYNSVLQVTLFTNTKDARIFYTTDGNEPTENSNVFYAPIQINDSVTIKAFTEVSGMKPSDVVSATYVVSDQQIDTSLINTRLPKPVLTIYPNPASDVARISWEDMVYDLDGVHITVTDARGTVMKRVVVKGGYTYYDLRTGIFADGVYFIRVQSGQQVAYGKLLVGR